MYGHTYSKSMDQPGKVANPARDQLNRENEYFSVPVRALEFGVARRVRQSRPASACPSQYCPEFIGSRNCVPMAFTAESPPAQDQ